MCAAWCGAVASSMFFGRRRSSAAISRTQNVFAAVNDVGVTMIRSFTAKSFRPPKTHLHKAGPTAQVLGRRLLSPLYPQPPQPPQPEFELGLRWLRWLRL